MVKSNKIKAQRLRLFWAQRGLCYACKRPMLEKQLERAKEFIDRVEREHGVVVSRTKAIKKLLCTLDHYVPVSENRSDRDHRNVAMCQECNQARSNHNFDLWLESYDRPTL